MQDKFKRKKQLHAVAQPDMGPAVRIKFVVACDLRKKIIEQVLDCVTSSDL